MNLSDLVSLVLIAFSLSADCFAVALCGSVSGKYKSFKPILRVSFSFGLFQTLMPVIGWFAGRTIIDFIADYDHWVAFVLLAGIGGRMLWEAFGSKDEDDAHTDITRGFLLLTLSLATSIDSLAVGLSFAFIKINILAASLTIGAVAFIVTAAGFLAGGKIGALSGKRAKVIGGLVLIGIGLKVLLADIFF